MRAKELLKYLRNTDYFLKSFQIATEKLFSNAPSNLWLTNFPRTNNFVIKNPTSIEEVNEFYEKNREILTNTHIRFIWNADEALHTSIMHFMAHAGKDMKVYSYNTRFAEVSI